jgi:hypothetical protein
MAAEEPSNSKSNVLLDQLVANSLFTRKQIAILSKRASGQPRHKNMTAGSYYRQVRQCKEKTIAVLYSLILLELIGAIDANSFTAIAKISAQLRVMLESENRDIMLQTRSEDVMSVIFQVIQRVCKV